MFIALSFVGILPAYITDCIYQIRLFNKEIPIYLIINDLKSPHLQSIQQYAVTIVDYAEIQSEKFTQIAKTNYDKFLIVHGLIGREELFLRTFERYFLLQNTMTKYNLKDGLFMEIDNLLYDDPKKWLAQFQTSDLTYMFDNYDRCSSGIMYVKSPESIQGLLDYICESIENHVPNSELLNEMTILYRYYTHNVGSKQINVGLAPILFPIENGTNEAYESANYDKYENTIFDAAAIGVMLLGVDPFHTDGKIVLYTKNPASLIDYTKYQFEWKHDENNRKIPHVLNPATKTWIKINNLHVHSKLLHNGLSIDPINGVIPCIHKETHEKTHYENVVLVPSIIETPNTAFSYSNIRSIYSKRERLSQTKRTVKTIKEKIPGAFIVIVECSPLTENERSIFDKSADLFINLYDLGDPNIIEKIHSKSKSWGEGTMTIQALETLNQRNIHFDRLFKLSGRYWLNEKFDYTRFIENNALANFYNDRMDASTILYKLTYSQTQKWLDYLHNADHHFRYCTGYEHIFSMFLRDVLETNPEESVIDAKNMGGCGYISVCGTFNEI